MSRGFPRLSVWMACFMTSVRSLSCSKCGLDGMDIPLEWVVLLIGYFD